jgi:hypothetical protein
MCWKTSIFLARISLHHAIDPVQPIAGQLNIAFARFPIIAFSESESMLRQNCVTDFSRAGYPG